MTLARRLLAPGWVPAALVYLLVVVLLRHTGHVGVGDTIRFTVWFVWSLTLPGTLLWRLLDWRRSRVLGTGRPLLEDLVLGSGVGLVATTGIYLVFVTLGAPWLTVAWPLLVLVPMALRPDGRRVALRRQAEPTPTWFSWGLAAVVTFAVLWSWHHAWGMQAITVESMRRPYVDEPFHLALIGELRHHFPAQFPFVAGVPLRYHWLVYPFMASATWGAGLDPVPVLRLLAPVALSALTLLGVAVAVSRLSGRRWAGIAAAALTCAVPPLDVLGWTHLDAPWRSTPWATYNSPTQAMADALCPLLIVLLVGLLRGAATRPQHWAATGVVMLAAAGAKSAMLPLFVAGLCGTVVVMLVVHRRVVWRLVALAAMSVGVFLAAAAIFYGSGSRALTLEPFQMVDLQAAGIHLVAPGATPSFVVRATLLIVFIGCTTAPLIGGLGLFARSGWRRPTPWVLLGCWVSALGVVLLVHHPALGQVYFLYCATVPAMVLGGLGLARAAGSMTRRTCTVVVSSLLLGLVIGALVPAITSHTPPEQSASSDLGRMVASFVVPYGLAAAALALVLLGFRVVCGRLPLLRGYGLLVGILVVIGMSLPYPLGQLLEFRHPPVQAVLLGGTPTVQPGGFTAARWLRDHSDPDDLVATNEHRRGQNAPGARDFWISGYAQRRVLVEGWAYIPPEAVGLPSTVENNASGGPPQFWDQPKIRLNDKVFAHPTRQDIEELRRTYGVKWLFAVKAPGVDLRRLTELTELREHSGQYSVFELPG